MLTYQQTFGWGDSRDVFSAYGDSGWPIGYGFPPPTYRDYYGRGEAIPFHLDEWQLKFLRDKSRVMCAQNEFAICAIENRRNYVINRGLNFRAVPADGGDENEDTKSVQKFIDLFNEANDLAERQGETMISSDIDGEAFVRLFYKDDGMTELRSIQPELVRSPGGQNTAHMSYGIETPEDDVETIKNYWIITDPSHSQTPEPIPESDIVHFKLNVRSISKRGLPTMYPIEANLRRAEDLLASMTSMAKTRAKIAFIRKMKQSPRAQAQSLVDDKTAISVTDPYTNTVKNIEQFDYSTIITSDGQHEYEFPTINVSASELVECLRAELRACAARLNMPEWMFTADSGVANYSNAFVTESPALKNFEYLQDYFKRRWGEGRYGQRKSILWRAIDNAIECGVLRPSVRENVKLVIEAQTLLSRDKDREAATNKLYLDMKVKSRQQIQQELGIDGEQTATDLENDPYNVPESPTNGTAQQEWNRTQPRMQTVRNGNKAAESFVAQTDDSSCGAACAMAVGQRFSRGPETLAGWREALETNDKGTKPGKILDFFGKLGLIAEGRSDMTLESLREALSAGCSVVCPISDDGGHYVVVSEVNDKSVIYNDPARGRIESPLAMWSESWHDDDSDGIHYPQYGIIVQPTEDEKMNQALLAEVRAMREEMVASKVTGGAPPVAVHVNIPNDLFASIKPPDVVLHVAPQPATTIVVEPAAVTVPPTVVNVEAPEITLPEIKIPPTVVNVEVPEIKIPQTVVNTPPAKEPEALDIEIIRDKTGKVTGARACKKDK